MSDQTTAADALSSGLPSITIERGDATPEEIATVVVLVAAAAGGDADDPARPRGGWTRKTRTFNPGAVRGAGWGGGF